ICLFLMGSSLLVVASGALWLYPLGAVLLGAGAVSTPASSHILAKYCPRHLAPVVFSIKQTGVPVGSLIGGLLIPALLGVGFYIATIGESVYLDAYGAAFVSALIVYSMVVWLQPFRAYFDSDRDPSVRPSFAGVSDTMKIVLSTPRLRDLAFGAFSFGGLQSIYAGFFILYLIDGLEYSEVDAGLVYAIASSTAVAARIGWGWLGSTLVSPRIVMGLIGVFGFVASVMVGYFDFGWSVGAITTVAILYNITALSWHGVLLAETARLAPPDQVGGVTGGVLSFTSIAMMIYPAIYGGMLAVTGSYGLGFFFAALPSLAAGFVFFRAPVEGQWLRIILDRLSWCLAPARLFYAFFITVVGAVIGAAFVYRSLLV
ncbi:MAG: MFS transporter, partial [Rhodospirillaceae bacterium]|nr:MFS transporter [Rhodospirillaceae bacterium]